MRQVGRRATGKLCIIKKCARPWKEVNKMLRYIKTPFSRSRKWVNCRNLNLPTYGSFAQSSSGSFNKIIFLRAGNTSRVLPLSRARPKSVRREIRVLFAAVWLEGESAIQRNGSQILCAFVVSGVQRWPGTIDRGRYARSDAALLRGSRRWTACEFPARVIRGVTTLLPDKRSSLCADFGP